MVNREIRDRYVPNAWLWATGWALVWLITAAIVGSTGPNHRTGDSDDRNMLAAAMLVLVLPQSFAFTFALAKWLGSWGNLKWTRRTKSHHRAVLTASGLATPAGSLLLAQVLRLPSSDSVFQVFAICAIALIGFIGAAIFVIWQLILER